MKSGEYKIIEVIDAWDTATKIFSIKRISMYQLEQNRNTLQTIQSIQYRSQRWKVKSHEKITFFGGKLLSLFRILWVLFYLIILDKGGESQFEISKTVQTYFWNHFEM